MPVVPPEFKILSTKPLPGEIKKELSGFALKEIEVIRIERIKDTEKALLDFLIKDNQKGKLALVVTSKNALSILSEIKRNPFDKLYCVGKKTALQLMAETGWVADQEARTAKELTQLIPENIEALVYPCSEQRLDVIPQFCRKNGILLHEFRVYKPVAVRMEQTIEADIICFYSPSGVKAFYDDQEYQGEMTLAIGPTTGKTLERYSRNVLVSEEPSLKGMVKEIKRLYSSKKNT